MTTYTYGVDAQGSHAEPYQWRLTLAQARRIARRALRHTGDRARLYRRPSSAYVDGPTEALAEYRLTRDPITGRARMERAHYTRSGRTRAHTFTARPYASPPDYLIRPGWSAAR